MIPDPSKLDYFSIIGYNSAMPEYKYQIGSSDLVATMVSLFEKDPGSIQVIQLQRQGETIGQFSASLVKEQDKSYIKIDNVQPTEIAAIFAKFDRSQGNNVIGGIYMIPYSPNKS